MRIVGQLIAVEENSGQFASRETGEMINWSNVTLRVFDGREVTVVKVKGDEAGAVARRLKGREGQQVVFDVDSPRSLDTKSILIHEDAKRG